ncbi:unnamed protein product, partial [Didymodactylos carnosus]
MGNRNARQQGAPGLDYYGQGYDSYPYEPMMENYGAGYEPYAEYPSGYELTEPAINNRGGEYMPTIYSRGILPPQNLGAYGGLGNTFGLSPLGASALGGLNGYGSRYPYGFNPMIHQQGTMGPKIRKIFVPNHVFPQFQQMLQGGGMGMNPMMNMGQGYGCGGSPMMQSPMGIPQGCGLGMQQPMMPMSGGSLPPNCCAMSIPISGAIPSASMGSSCCPQPIMQQMPCGPVMQPQIQMPCAPPMPMMQAQIPCPPPIMPQMPCLPQMMPQMPCPPPIMPQMPCLPQMMPQMPEKPPSQHQMPLLPAGQPLM